MVPPEISIADLRSAITRLLDATEARFGPNLCFLDDFYWNVPHDAATMLDRDPTCDLGSLADDASSIREYVASDPEEDTVIWHEAEHLVGVLRAIARLDTGRGPCGGSAG